MGEKEEGERGKKERGDRRKEFKKLYSKRYSYGISLKIVLSAMMFTTKFAGFLDGTNFGNEREQRASIFI